MILVWDSQVRHLDIVFCVRKGTRKTRVCQPGVGIDKLVARLDTCLEDNGTKPMCFLIARENDFSEVISEECFRKFRPALDKRSNRCNTIIYCVLQQLNITLICDIFVL